MHPHARCLRPPALAFCKGPLFCTTFPTEPSGERRGNADASGGAAGRDEQQSSPPAPQDQRRCLPARTRPAPVLSHPPPADALLPGPAFPKLPGYPSGAGAGPNEPNSPFWSCCPLPTGQTPTQDQRVPSPSRSAGSAQLRRRGGGTPAGPSRDTSLLQRRPARLRWPSPVCPLRHVSALNDALVSQQMVYSTIRLRVPEY